MKCPKCGGRRLAVLVYQSADVRFMSNGDHEVEDVYGDVEFDGESRAICKVCHWNGVIDQLED
jgi:hypothetical protein